MAMVYIGDLHRYKQQQQQQQQQQAEDAARTLYLRAGCLQPWNGLAWNQTALMCSSSNDVLRAAFYYMRAASSRVPFSAAAENLRLLLERSREAVSFCCLRFHTILLLF
jgi:hypothetical protein